MKNNFSIDTNGVQWYNESTMDKAKNKIAAFLGCYFPVCIVITGGFFHGFLLCKTPFREYAVDVFQRI